MLSSVPKRVLNFNIKVMEKQSITDLVNEVLEGLQIFLPTDRIDGLSMHINIAYDQIQHPTLSELTDLGFDDIDIMDGTTVYEMVHEEQYGLCSMMITFTLAHEQSV